MSIFLMNKFYKITTIFWPVSFVCVNSNCILGKTSINSDLNVFIEVLDIFHYFVSQPIINEKSIFHAQSLPIIKISEYIDFMNMKALFYNKTDKRQNYFLYTILQVSRLRWKWGSCQSR